MPRVKKVVTRKKSPKKKGVMKKKGVLDRIAPIGFDESEGLKINLYGASATGKTTLWSTFPKPILAVVCSGGMKPGELKSINTKENRKTIKQVVLEDPEEIYELIEHQKETGEFATIVLDHASGYQDLCLRDILDLPEIPAKMTWGVATQQTWGQVGVKVTTAFRALLGLDCNVVIVAQERAFNTDSEASELLIPYVASALIPSVTGWLNPACDCICQTFIRGKTETVTTKVGKKSVKKFRRVPGVDYCLRTAPDPVYTSKFRVPKGTPLPEEIVDPSYDKIIRLINGG